MMSILRALTSANRRSPLAFVLLGIVALATLAAMAGFALAAVLIVAGLLHSRSRCWR